MKKKDFQTYKIIEIDRENIKSAPYNPRKISDKAMVKLKKSMNKYGLVQPIVYNIQTGNIVSGHQRVKILDDIFKGENYKINVAMIDLPIEDEVKLNVLLNNENAMGKFDIDMLANIKIDFPDIDFETDLLFEKIDLDFMVSESPTAIQVFSENDTIKTKSQTEIENDLNKIKNARTKFNQEAHEKNKKGDDNAYAEYDNYLLTVVFGSNAEKEEFMHKICKEPKEKYIKSNILFDLENGKFKS